MNRTVALIALFLGGCATQLLNTKLQGVIGQPVDVLVRAWGYPADQREIMGKKLYIWSNDAGVVAVPLYGGGAIANRLNCTVQVGVDGNDVITNYQWNGNNGGCATFARRLN